MIVLKVNIMFIQEICYLYSISLHLFWGKWVGEFARYTWAWPSLLHSFITLKASIISPSASQSLMKLHIKVKPNAKQTKVEITEEGLWIVSVSAQPINGQANRALIKLLAKQLKVAKSQIFIRSGYNQRYKVIEVLEE